MASDTDTDTDTRATSARSVGRMARMWLSVWAAVALGLATAVASGYLGARWAAEELRSELTLRPPVVLFDMAGAVRGVAPDRLAAMVAREKVRAKRLGDAGLLVLDAQAVIAAPPDLHIDAAVARDDRGGPPR
jgi:hypothetical protein